VTTLAALAILAPFLRRVGLLLGAGCHPRGGRRRHRNQCGTGDHRVSTVAGDPNRVWESASLLTPTGTIPVTIGVVSAVCRDCRVMVSLVRLPSRCTRSATCDTKPRYSSYARWCPLFTAAMLTVVLSATC